MNERSDKEISGGIGSFMTVNRCSVEEPEMLYLLQACRDVEIPYEERSSFCQSIIV